jgi:hypothetical protein
VLDEMNLARVEHYFSDLLSCMESGEAIHLHDDDAVASGETEDGVHYLVTIKSGPNWGNSGQIRKMKDDFAKARRILHTNAADANVVCVNGCCYGKTGRKPHKGTYVKYCGQPFWELISGSDRLYVDIVEPLGHRAKEKNEQFQMEYDKVVNRFTKDFIEDFCDDEGAIVWEALVTFNSGHKSSRTA